MVASPQFKVKQSTLRNGFKILTLRLPRVESVSTGLFVKAGSRFEDDSNNGVSHFLEHLVFKGSKKYPSQLAIAKSIESLGGVINAYTSEDHTLFWNKVPAYHWQKAIAVLCDLVFNPLLPKEGIEKERGVILQEIARKEDLPEKLVWEVFHETIWANDCLGRGTLGSFEVISHIQRDDFIDYRNRCYLPNNMVLVSVGKISHRRLVDFVRSYAGRLKPGGVPECTVNYVQEDVQMQIRDKKIEQRHLVLGCQGYSLFSSKRYALAVLATLLGRGQSSRLFEEIREKSGLAYVIGTVSSLYEDAGYLSVYAGVSPDKLNLTVTKILHQLIKVKKKLVPRNELAAAKEKICGPLMFSLETTEGWIRFLGAKMLLEKKIETLPEVIKKVKAITPSQVREVANELFVDERLNLAVVGTVKNRSQLKDKLHF